jgi:hypothetical protein
MSTTTAPVEIEVPREFLPAFVIAGNMEVMKRVDGLENGLSLDYTQHGRVRDDEKIAVLQGSIDGREALLRALDGGGPLPVAMVQRYIEDAIEHFRSVLRDLVDENVNAETAAEVARILRDLIAWGIGHDLAIATADPITEGDYAAWAHIADAAGQALDAADLSPTGREQLADLRAAAREAAGDATPAAIGSR